MNKAKYVHAKSVFFFSGNVIPQADGFVVVSKKDGSLMQAVRNEKCITEELGGSHPVCGDPIAREQRLFKLSESGKVEKHPDFDSRVELAKVLCGEDKVALSVSKLKAAGYVLDEKLNIVSRPEAKTA